MTTKSLKTTMSYRRGHHGHAYHVASIRAQAVGTSSRSVAPVACEPAVSMNDNEDNVHTRGLVMRQDKETGQTHSSEEKWDAIARARGNECDTLRVLPPLSVSK